MSQNTLTIRISALNKHMIENHVMVNFKEKNKSVDNPTIDELITFLIQENLSIYYPKLKSKSENDIKRN